MRSYDVRAILWRAIVTVLTSILVLSVVAGIAADDGVTALNTFGFVGLGTLCTTYIVSSYVIETADWDSVRVGLPVVLGTLLASALGWAALCVVLWSHPRFGGEVVSLRILSWAGAVTAVVYTAVVLVGRRRRS